jgi:hypothetical protein
MKQLLAEKYSIRLYGSCGVGVKEGVVRTALDFVPATTVLGAAASAYLLYACDRSASCYNCNAQCPLRQVWDALKQRELAISHFVSVSQQEGDPLKEYFLYWFQLRKRAPRKSVHAHVALNRAVKSVQQMVKVGNKSEVELRGLFYGDEVWAPPSNEFYGFLVASSRDTLVAAQEVMSFLDLAQLGGRGKYCFVEVTGREPLTSVNAFLEELSKSWDKGSQLVAAGGLAFTQSEAEQNLLRAYSLRIRAVDIERMVPRAYTDSRYVSLYELLLGNVERIYVSTTDPPPVLRIDEYRPEYSLTGMPDLKLSPLGWNRVVPVNWVKGHVQAK